MIDLEELIRNRQDELRGYPLPPPSRFRVWWEDRPRHALDWLDDRTGEITCYCGAAALFFYALALVLKLIAGAPSCG